MKGSILNLEDEKTHKERKSVCNSELLHVANDWLLLCDNPANSMTSPFHVAQTSLRQDTVIYSNSIKQVFMMELTVSTEDNVFRITQNFKRT